METYIYAPDKIEGGEGLLAIVSRNRPTYDKPSGATFLTEKDNPLQLGILRYKAHDEVKPHVHLSRSRTTERTQEVLFVRYGCVTVTIYTSEGEKVRTVTLTGGDCILLIAGGHSLLSYGGAEVVEVKLGPYTGRENDKTPLQVRE